ncbi:MAG: 3-dehydroquinate synthase [Dehalococcoidia bacterium]|jgi:3-dehydroquinate synthase
MNDLNLAAKVKVSSGEHPIWVGWDILDTIGEKINEFVETPIAYIIADQNVQKYVRKIQTSLESVSIKAHVFIIPPGEESKNLNTVRSIYDWLASMNAERKHLVIALGGGVIGDMVGFVAATYLRGMPLVHVPTTLLAMMDSSIGGKVAVDLPEGKNLVGAFYQPKFVMSDVSILKTLPERELNSGWAEAIKHGLILDKDLFDIFENKSDELFSLDPELSTEIIRKSVSIKADVVSKDEKEQLGIRILLNYGHTIGHAIETVTKYKDYLHGEAVSIGMMGAAQIAYKVGLVKSLDIIKRQKSLFIKYKLPTNFNNIDTKQIFSAMHKDKKKSNGDINWVLLDSIGNAVTMDNIPDSIVMDSLRELTEN